MDEVKIIILAVIQGITEFLPISSSGHLVLFENLFGLYDNSIATEVVLHFGTLISILIYFRNDILDLLSGALKGNKESNTYIVNILIATIPIVIFVLLFEDSIKSVFSTKTLLYTYLVNMVILYLTKDKRSHKNNITYSLAIFMGLAQVFAIFPGISRAGITICTGLLLGYNQNTVARFSFFMAIPALVGAIIFEFNSISEQSVYLILIGLLFSMLTGLLALKFLFKILQNRNLWIFSYYCFLIWCVIAIMVQYG